MAFDAVVANPGRLQILTALAVEERQDFVQLRDLTQLTDGNLSAHARKLQTAGLVQIDKEFRDGKPVTSFLLTPAGRSALESHVRRLLAAISHRRMPTANPSTTPPLTPKTPAAADDWVD
jgi:DNA-binding MarR family transcriptional regulator